MPSTPTYALPYPGGGDPPSGATQIQALAVATETAIKSVTATQDARDDGQDSRLSTLELRVPHDSVSWGVQGVNFAAGVGTLTHGTGWVPTVAVVTPGTGSTPLFLTIDTSPGSSATQLHLVAIKADGSTFTGTAQVNYILRK